MTDGHAVLPADEARHPPGPDDLWNESYYCDFVTLDGALGGWLRLGLYPNRKVAWWTTWIVRPGHPGICSVDYRAPVPGGDRLTLESDTLGRVGIDLSRPLHTFRLVAETAASVVTAAQDVYAVAPAFGRRTKLTIDLSWTTDGSPYHYDLTTRYEVPCLVSGTVTVGDERSEVEGYGQRDHSWGVRDWWSFGWCWCAVRLDDGTRVHVVDARIPGTPALFGYVQDPARQEVLAAAALSVVEDLGPHGFPSRARIEVGAGDVATVDAPPAVQLGIEVEPLAFAPLLLRSDDARISRFPRAMARCRTDDGRAGAGWIEWNQPEAPPPEATTPAGASASPDR